MHYKNNSAPRLTQYIFHRIRVYCQVIQTHRSEATLRVRDHSGRVNIYYYTYRYIHNIVGI